MECTVLDFCVAIFLAVGLFIGLVRGLSGELARAAAALLVAGAGFRFYPALSDTLQAHTRITPAAAPALAFLLILLCGLTGFVILRHFFKRLLQPAFRGPVERIGGALAGLLRCTVILLAFLFFCSLAPVAYLQRYVLQASRSGQLYLQYVVPLLERLPARRYRDRIADGLRERLRRKESHEPYLQKNRGRNP